MASEESILDKCPERPTGVTEFEFHDGTGCQFMVRLHHGEDWILYYRDEKQQWFPRVALDEDKLRQYWRVAWMERLIANVDAAIGLGKETNNNV